MKTLVAFLGSFTMATLLFTACDKDRTQQVNPDTQYTSTVAKPDVVGNGKKYDDRITDINTDPCVKGDSYCKDIVIHAPAPKSADMLTILATGTPATLIGLYNSDAMTIYMADLKNDAGFKKMIADGAYSRMIDDRDGRKVYAFSATPDVLLNAQTPVVSIRY
jgi:hypothetical protein